MNETLNRWTTIYDDGHESICVIGDEKNNLYCAYCDQDGDLERFSCKASAPASSVKRWLDAHSVDSAIFDRSPYTPVWERIYRQYSDRSVKSLVNGLRNCKEIPFGKDILAK